MAIDWNAVKAQSAAPPPQARAAPSPGGAIDWHAIKQGGPPAAAPSVLGQVGNAAKTVATGVGNAMDAQRYGVAKLLTGKDNTDDQRTAERQAVGTQGIYDAMGHIPLVGHALQGASDVVQDTVMDPLMYETLGAGPILKGLGLADKAAVAMDRVGKAVTDTPLGAAVHDFTHWGGAVGRQHGDAMVNRLRGTGNLASSEGAGVQKQLMEDFEKIHGSLSDAEKVRVGKALNGEIQAVSKPVKPNAYRYQSTEDGIENSRLRNSTFFYEGNYDRANPLTRDEYAGKGKTLQQAEVNPKNPLVLNPQGPTRELGDEAVKALLPGEQGEALLHAISGELNAAGHATDAEWKIGTGKETAGHYLAGLGVEKSIIDEILAKRTSSAAIDRIAAELARKQGHDAIIMPWGDAKDEQMARNLMGPHFDPEQHLMAREMAVLDPKIVRHTSESIQSDLTPHEQKAFHGLRSLTEQDLEHRTKTAQTIAFNAVSHGLSDEDASLLKRALDENKPPEVPEAGPRIRVPGQGDSANARSREINKNVGLDETGENLGQPRTGPVLIGQLPKPQAPFTRPISNQADVDRMTKLRDLYTNIQAKVEQNVPKREDYFPTAHEGEPKPESAAAKTVSEKDYYDPRTKERDDVHVTDAAQMRAGFEAMARNTGRQVKTGVINGQLGRLLDDPEIDKLFQRTIAATGDARTNTQKVKDAWLKVIGYPRAATVSLTPRHGMNILDLAANTVPPHLLPKYTADVTKLTKQLLSAKSEDAYQALTKEGRDLGALSGDFRERQAFFQQFPGWMPGVGGKSTGPLGAYTAMNNKLVWAIDEAAKQTYAKLLVDTGEATGLEAGGLASSRLVDYTHTSPMVQALKYVAPFGTFRGSVPGAVVGGIVRNPARAALLNRATGGTMYGSRPGKGQSGAEFYGPTSDVARGLDAPQDFIRGTLGQPVQAAATMGIEAATGNPGASAQTTLQELRDLPNQIMRGQFSKMGVPGKISPYAKAVALRTARYLNYRHPIDLQFLTDWAASGVPEAGAVLEMLGHSQFSNPNGPSTSSMGNEALRQSTGISIR